MKINFESYRYKTIKISQKIPAQEMLQCDIGDSMELTENLVNFRAVFNDT